MIHSLHCLRPAAFFCFIPVIFLYYLLQKKQTQHPLENICDPHLLPHLIHTQVRTRRYTLFLIFNPLTWMILALSGPTWIERPVPVFQSTHAHIILWNVSSSMLTPDIAPNRLDRAKYKLHDILRTQPEGQWALMVYTAMPFIVSPLTEDTRTIDALLDDIHPNMMPIDGDQLHDALLESHDLLKHTPSSKTDLLVLTGTPPTPQDLETARILAKQGFSISILPLQKKVKDPIKWTNFAKAGHGQVYAFTETADDILSWQKETQQRASFQKAQRQSQQAWEDEGRFFLIPACLSFLLFFRKGFSIRASLS